jgi:hypothetical protein
MLISVQAALAADLAVASVLWVRGGEDSPFPSVKDISDLPSWRHVARNIILIGNAYLIYLHRLFGVQRHPEYPSLVLQTYCAFLEQPRWHGEVREYRCMSEGYQRGC